MPHNRTSAFVALSPSRVHSVACKTVSRDRWTAWTDSMVALDFRPTACGHCCGDRCCQPLSIVPGETRREVPGSLVLYSTRPILLGGYSRELAGIALHLLRLNAFVRADRHCACIRGVDAC